MAGQPRNGVQQVALVLRPERDLTAALEEIRTWATAAGVGGSPGRVRSQSACQWVFSTPERQAR